MTDEPQDMLFGLVCAFLTLRVLLAQPEAQSTQPLLVGQALACPDGTRVVGMGSFVGSLVRLVGMSRIQQLSGFQDHLDDMFVAVLFGSPPWVSGQYEDVHQNSFPANLCFHFCNATCLSDLL